MARGVALATIRAYKRLVSPWLPAACRYEPTCSEFAYEAIETHGVARGAWLAACRLSRCHPFARGGFDPVPGRFSPWRPRTEADRERAASRGPIRRSTRTDTSMTGR